MMTAQPAERQHLSYRRPTAPTAARTRLRSVILNSQRGDILMWALHASFRQCILDAEGEGGSAPTAAFGLCARSGRSERQRATQSPLWATSGKLPFDWQAPSNEGALTEHPRSSRL